MKKYGLGVLILLVFTGCDKVEGSWLLYPKNQSGCFTTMIFHEDWEADKWVVFVSKAQVDSVTQGHYSMLDDNRVRVDLSGKTKIYRFRRPEERKLLLKEEENNTECRYVYDGK
ncbi:hypothetical protein [Salinithrix halophila]|uniref:Lipoprotein n=1 Tax=Salinithrix halophila TaxID=1485204 RepID=A0ABV8JDC5_9BACL